MISPYCRGEKPRPIKRKQGKSQLRRWQILREAMVVILWMDEILHHLETMGNHCLLVFTGDSSFQGFLDGAGFRPSTVLTHWSTPTTIMEPPNDHGPVSLGAKSSPRGQTLQVAGFFGRTHRLEKTRMCPTNKLRDEEPSKHGARKI